MVIQTAHALLTRDGAAVAANDPILLSSIGGVLAGAVFGDHCSPISDTTVLSSQSSGCDHLEHVWTQMPYALLAGTISIAIGTIPIGFGVSVWVLLPIQIASLFVFMRLFGSRPDAD
jgi:Na+/H+ antiporter NhaC